MTKIELMYFEGCPSYEPTLKNLKNAVQDFYGKFNIMVTRIDSAEQARNLKFFGSPTIRVSGQDLEGETGTPGMACRLYLIDGKQTGVPPVDYLKEKLSTLS